MSVNMLQTKTKTKTKTIATMFSGGGLVEAGLGLKPLGNSTSTTYEFAFAIECNPAIAEVYRANISSGSGSGSSGNQHLKVSRVQDVNPYRLERPDLLWASPECKEFSIAKQTGTGGTTSGKGTGTGKGQEGPEQLSQAAAIVHFLQVLQPPAFILENVRGYLKSQSFQRIVLCLNKLGYELKWNILNTADYGVAQTRERLILRAVLGNDRPVPSLPARAVRRIGWYEAIADLIPTLPESKFADWQLKQLQLQQRLRLQQQHQPQCRRRLVLPPSTSPQQQSSYQTLAPAPVPNPQGFLVSGRANLYSTSISIRDAGEPALTVTATEYKHLCSAYVNGGNGDSDESYQRQRQRQQHQYSHGHGHGHGHSFVISGGNAAVVRSANEPYHTVTSSEAGRGRAYLCPKHGANESFTCSGGSWAITRCQDEPHHTVTVTEIQSSRSYITDGIHADNNSSDASDGSVGASLIDKYGHSQQSTDTTTTGYGYGEGRVVKMTARAMARFQSVPDWYELPEGRGQSKLCSTILGNGVPSEFARQLIEATIW